MTIAKTASPTYRWLILWFLNVAVFGNYYIYDSISPVADVLREQLHFSDTQIGLLNGVYSIANIVMVLFGLIVAIQNLGLATSNGVAGWVNDIAGASAENPTGYVPILWIFASLACLGAIFAFLLRRSELGAKGHGLEDPEESTSEA